MAAVLSREYAVRTAHLGPEGLLAAAALMEMAQDAARRHAVALGFGLERLQSLGRTWLLRRFRLDWIERRRELGSLTIQTWPSGRRGVQALRDYRVVDAADRVLAAGASSWLMIDFERRRPVRLPPDFLRIVPAPETSRLEKSMPDSELEARAHKPLLVTAADCDSNRHLNHVRAIDHLLDFGSECGLAEQHLRAFSVEFRSEAVAGDRLELCWRPLSGSDAWLWARTREQGRPIAVLLAEA